MLSKDFKKRITGAFGKQGVRWLSCLPDLMVECEKDFAIKIGKSFDNLSFNFIAEAKNNNGEQYVVKLAVPTSQVLSEIEALTAMQGTGIVRLIKADAKKGFILLERILPGKRLVDLHDEKQSVKIFGRLATQIKKEIKPNHSFNTTEALFEEMKMPIQLPSAFEQHLLNKARTMAKELHEENDKHCLLHGDLHHYNILSHNDNWCAIDPHGVVGPFAYEAAAFMRNPIPDIANTPYLKSVLQKRLDFLSVQLNIDKQKLQAWSFAGSVLAAFWCLEMKNDDWQLFLYSARALMT